MMLVTTVLATELVPGVRDRRAVLVLLELGAQCLARLLDDRQIVCPVAAYCTSWPETKPPLSMNNTAAPLAGFGW